MTVPRGNQVLKSEQFREKSIKKWIYIIAELFDAIKINSTTDKASLNKT
jgi:hypothetical protein